MAKQVSKKKNQQKQKKISPKPIKPKKKITKEISRVLRKNPLSSSKPKSKLAIIQKKIKKGKKSQLKAKPKHFLKELENLNPKQFKEKKQKEIFIKCVNCRRQHKLLPGDEYLLRRQKYFVCKQLTQMECVQNESVKKSKINEIKKQTKLMSNKSKLIKKSLKQKNILAKKDKSKKKKNIYSWIQCEACDRWFQLYEEQNFLLQFKNFYCKDILGIACKEYQKKFPQKNFKSEAAEIKYLLKTSQFDKVHVDQWIQCTKCQKWRLATTEKEFNKLSKKRNFSCQDVSKNCKKKEDKVDTKYISIKK